MDVWILDYPICANDCIWGIWQSTCNPCGYKKPRHADSQKCLHRELGCIRPNAMPHNHAIDTSRNTVSDVAGM